MRQRIERMMKINGAIERNVHEAFDILVVILQQDAGDLEILGQVHFLYQDCTRGMSKYEKLQALGFRKG